MSLPIACHHERERGYVCPFCKTFRLSPERPGAGSYSVEGTYRAANQNVEIIRLALVPSPQFYNDSGKLVYRTDEEPSAGIGREVLDAVKLRHLRNEIRRWHQGFREHAEQVGAGSLTTRLDASLQAMSPPPPANPGKRYDDNQRAIVARAYLDALREKGIRGHVPLAAEKACLSERAIRWWRQHILEPEGWIKKTLDGWTEGPRLRRQEDSDG